jgi:hypothetical protein
MLEWNVAALVHVLVIFSLGGVAVGTALAGLFAALDL